MNADTIKTNIKRFISNPNTITFLLVIALIIGVYIIYSALVNRAVQPVNLPYAVDKIKGKTEIVQENINTAKISGTFVTASGQNLVQNSYSIIGKYVKPGYEVPANSFFYQEALTDSSIADETDFTDIPNNYTIYALDTDFHETYGCSIMPGNYIDLYFKTELEGGLIVYDLFIKSIKVTKVVDSKGEDVFTSTADGKNPQPAKLYFTVPIEYNNLLKKAEMINGITLIPIPRNTNYSLNPEETKIANEAIESYINSKSVYIAN